ncbi:hypothetical protein D9M71_132730 [compost metagenome]
MGLLEVFQAVAVVDRLGGHGTLLRSVIDRLRRRGAAVGRVDRDLVGVSVALEQRQLTGRELVLVLGDVVLGDDEQRLVAFERVAEEAVAIHRRGARLEAAGPGGDATVGVAGLFRAQRGQGGAQLGGFIGGYGSHHAGSHQGKRQGAGFQHSARFHVSCPLSGVYQKFTPRLSETKSRSVLVLKSPPKKLV